MNKTDALKVSTIVCAAVLIAALGSGIRSVAAFAGYQYADADQYSAGNAEIRESVKNLEIDWVSGAVIFEYQNTDTIVISEKAKKELKEDEQLRWRLDGDTLKIRFAKSGFRTLTYPEKELTVTLPEGIIFDNVNVGTTSGDIEIPALETDKLVLDVTSGNISASVKARKISGDATSGSMTLDITGDAEEISAESTFGNITVTAANADKVKAETTSGIVRVTMKDVEKFKAETTSGGVQAELGETKEVKIGVTSGDISVKAAAFEKLDVEATSGNVTAELPAKPGFTGSFEVTGGEIAYELPMEKQGKKYVCGDGSGTVKISTTSGDIMIKELAE